MEGFEGVLESVAVTRPSFMTLERRRLVVSKRACFELMVILGLYDCER